jgi:GGDEF domain-containing protein
VVLPDGTPAIRTRAVVYQDGNEAQDDRRGMDERGRRLRKDLSEQDPPRRGISSSRRRARIEHIALHDLADGLPTGYLDEMPERHVPTRRGSNGIALQIDLDRFKEINDTLGHAAGMQCLCMLQRC